MHAIMKCVERCTDTLYSCAFTPALVAHVYKETVSAYSTRGASASMLMLYLHGLAQNASELKFAVD